jgi:hypothetical protein
MILPEGLFGVAVIAAYVGVSLGSGYLLVVLVREWIRKELW